MSYLLASSLVLLFIGFDSFRLFIFSLPTLFFYFLWKPQSKQANIFLRSQLRIIAHLLLLLIPSFLSSFQFVSCPFHLRLLRERSLRTSHPANQSEHCSNQESINRLIDQLESVIHPASNSNMEDLIKEESEVRREEEEKRKMAMRVRDKECRSVHEKEGRRRRRTKISK